MNWRSAGWGMLLVCLAGCATTPYDAALVRGAARPDYSVRHLQRDFVVAVSPAGKTLRLAGSTGLVVGAGVDAVVNDRNRRAVVEALRGDDPQALFERRLKERLGAALPAAQEVPALVSTAGFGSMQEAEEARCAGLAKQGADVVLDFALLSGLFGPEAALVARLDGKVTDLRTGKTLWSESILVTPGPVLADGPEGNPMGGTDFGPVGKLKAIRSPRLAVAEGALDRWTSEGGAPLRAGVAEAVDGAVAAALVALGLADDARGQFCLGVQALREGEHSEAEARFARALALDPAMLEARNARAVNLARNKQIDEAIAALEALVREAPDYGPAWYNLAWCLAAGGGDQTAVASARDRAKALGMPASRAVDKALEAAR